MICRRVKRGLTVFLLLSACYCGDSNNGMKEVELAANEEMADFIRSFKGRGVLSDGSAPTDAQEALTKFRHAGDLAVDLVLAEPSIVQPVHISFDHRGRLWVVQYNQYPYPKGLKITGADNYLRLQFDKKPPPPPAGLQGADKITIFEDTDHDGIFDKSTDAITGLNIATSVLLGRGKIWVLNPPYLLSYPDPNDDGIPDGDPSVELDGFGIEDTHSVANSLTWGPDGWIYGVLGSTTTANVSSAVTSNIAFQGQAVWRYHPHTRVFELFAEGGGNNPFNIEFDDQGRIFSGTNDTDRGPYYKQGAYYVKKWGKHGPLTNPYAFGHLPPMRFSGERVRFTHAMVRYGGGTLPSHYEGKMIAVNPLLNYVEVDTMKQEGSTFAIGVEKRVLETEDSWFRPVAIKTGPDGAVYLADWYDSRLSHVDPRDTWDKTRGRVYRLRNKDSAAILSPFDLSHNTSKELVALLTHENRWFRQEALRILGDRQDSTVIPGLFRMMVSDNGQLALEACWALHLSGGFNEKAAMVALAHKNPHVRMWAVRLLGDEKTVSTQMARQLKTLAAKENDPEVLSQLACTAKRLPAEDALPLLANLLKREVADDPDIPLLIWWALESKAELDRERVLTLFEEASRWKNPVIQHVILKRLMQRYIMAGGQENYAAAERLLRLAPTPALGRILVEGLEEAIGGSSNINLTQGLTDALAPYRAQLGEGPLSLAMRQGNQQAISQALEVIENAAAPMGERLSYTKILSEIRHPDAVPVLIRMLGDPGSSPALLRAILRALPAYDQPDIGGSIIRVYMTRLRSDEGVRLAALDLFTTRVEWAQQFFRAVKQRRTISTNDVPDYVARRFKTLQDPEITKMVHQLWPELRSPTAAEKTAQIERFSKALQQGGGNVDTGRVLYLSTCGACHKLFGQGGDVGPDLTGYERTNTGYMLVNIIDPNADIREGYEDYRLTLKDGRVLQGRIVGREGNSITLHPFAGESITLPNDEILQIQAQRTSIMPERLLEGMSDQQLRDLFAHIRRDNAARKDDTNK